MRRKTLLSLLLIAMLCSFVSLPVFAVDLTVEPLVDMDFQSGEMVDKVGTAQINLNGNVTIKDDSEYGKVAVMEVRAGTTCQYEINGLDIADLNEYTIELFVKMTNPGDLDVMSVGDDTNVNIVALTAITYFGAGPDKDIIATNAIPRDNWTHVVATSDGKQQFLYFNGEIVAEDEFTVRNPFKNENTIYLGSDERSVSMEVGFFRFYKNAATEDDVGILYEDAQYFGTGASSDPSEEPSSEEPTVTPAPTEEAEPTTAPTAAPKPTATAEPAETSSSGISTPVIITLVAVLVILIAAVVVLVIVLKKRKK